MEDVLADEVQTTEKETIEKPATGEDSTPTPADVQERSGLADEVAKWKAMSRKNENRATENYQKLTETNGRLVEAEARIARLEAQRKYPQISDEAFGLCAETDPEKISDWADRYAALNPLNVSEEPKQVKREPVQMTVPDPAAAVGQGGSFSAKPVKGEAYKAAMERQRSRRRTN